MQRLLLFLTLLMAVSSCSYRQATGASVGGMLGSIFGSAIGGLAGGPRGHDMGTLIGGLSGAAVGSAIGQQMDEREAAPSAARPPRHARPEARPVRPVPKLEVRNLRLIDPNHNRSLDRDERCVIAFEVYNRDRETLYHIAPILTSSAGNRVQISPPAVMEYLAPGRGMRYQAVVVRRGRVRQGTVRFVLSFDVDGRRFDSRTFSLRAE